MTEEIFVSRARLDEDEFSEFTSIEKAKRLLRLRNPDYYSEQQEIQKLKAEMNRISKTLETILKYYTTEPIVEIEPKKATKSEVKNEVLKIIHEKPGCKTSDILFELNFEPSIVLEVLQELKTENKVKSKQLDK